MSFDVILKNGKVVDGCGNPWFSSDLAIKDGKIVKIGQISQDNAKRVIDVSNLVVSPGFIDIHDHSDIDIFHYPKAELKVNQGVTTVLVGNCGSSAAPLTDISKNIIENQKGSLTFSKIDIRWKSFKEYLNQIEEKGISINFAALMGHTTIREGVLGLEGRDPNPNELLEMKKLVKQAMQDGAFGISTGLIYSPGHYAKTNEVSELVKVCAEYGGIYATHIRGHGTKDIEGLKEAIKIAEDANIRTQISHIETHLPDAWGKEENMLKILEDARDRGLDVACDVLPHMGHVGDNILEIYFQHFQELPGGVIEFVKKLHDKKFRESIKKSDLESRSKLSSLIVTAPENIRIFDLASKTLKTLAEEAKKDPFDYVIELILEGINTGKTYSGVVVLHNEEDIRTAIKHPLTSISADGALEGEGLMDYANYPLAFRKYVRGESRDDFPEEIGKKILNLEEFTRKSTSSPALRMGLYDRGLIKKGMWADIVVFNEDTISDVGNYENFKHNPIGIEYVLVNGELVIEKGNHTSALPGKVLRHK